MFVEQFVNLLIGTTLYAKKQYMCSNDQGFLFEAMDMKSESCFFSEK